MTRKAIEISQPTDTRGLAKKESWVKLQSEEGFSSEWKQGNTPNEKPGNPAFGGAFFCPLQWAVSPFLVVYIINLMPMDQVFLQIISII